MVRNLEDTVETRMSNRQLRWLRAALEEHTCDPLLLSGGNNHLLHAVPSYKKEFSKNAEASDSVDLNELQNLLVDISIA